MARRPGEKGRTVRDAGFLGSLRNAVDVGTQGDDGLARSPGRHPRGGHAGYSLLHAEPVLLQDVDAITRGFKFLEPELAKAEDLVDGLLGEFLHPLDFITRLVFWRP